MYPFFYDLLGSLKKILKSFWLSPDLVLKILQLSNIFIRGIKIEFRRSIHRYLEQVSRNRYLNYEVSKSIVCVINHTNFFFIYREYPARVIFTKQLLTTNIKAEHFIYIIPSKQRVKKGNNIGYAIFNKLILFVTLLYKSVTGHTSVSA